ncbi:MAG: phosphate acyltransferase PlsX [Acidibacter sp.]|jgi:glycerol-3-phosphate acyltransferase PlsX|nr:phosphate acyltransferase PlsX [Acidibacter sp.]
MTLIALDVMSGDLGAQECVPAALLALESDSSLRLQLVGQASVIAPLLDAAAPAAGVRDRLELIEASEIITMTDAPREAIRRKKQSSMRIAADLVHDGLAEGMVSAGNTGALTAISHFVLKCLPEVERAPIMTSIPNRRAFTQLLDVGANLRATPVQLRQFAIMGAIVARDVHGRERPRVGLLNIGEEETKGHDLVQEAHALLKDLRVAFEYVGFVEGQDIFSGEVDVVVTDGFTGNVALKTMEGVAGLIGDRLKREFTADLPSKLAGLAARPVLKRVSGSLDPRRYNGAIMVGLKHIVVKSHGSADRYAMAQAIAIAATAVRKQLVQHVSQALGSGDHSTC